MERMEEKESDQAKDHYYDAIIICNISNSYNKYTDNNKMMLVLLAMIIVLMNGMITISAEVMMLMEMTMYLFIFLSGGSFYSSSG